MAGVKNSEKVTVFMNITLSANHMFFVYILVCRQF